MDSENKTLIKDMEWFVKTMQNNLVPDLPVALFEVTDFTEFYGGQCVQALHMPCSQHFIKDISSGSKHSILACVKLPDRKYPTFYAHEST